MTMRSELRFECAEAGVVQINQSSKIWNFVDACLDMRFDPLRYTRARLRKPLLLPECGTSVEVMHDIIDDLVPIYMVHIAIASFIATALIMTEFLVNLSLDLLRVHCDSVLNRKFGQDLSTQEGRLGVEEPVPADRRIAQIGTGGIDDSCDARAGQKINRSIFGYEDTLKGVQKT